jgi:hypothetical protein
MLPEDKTSTSSVCLASVGSTANKNTPEAMWNHGVSHNTEICMAQLMAHPLFLLADVGKISVWPGQFKRQGGGHRT